MATDRARSHDRWACIIQRSAVGCVKTKMHGERPDPQGAESVAGPVLDALGYDRVFVQKGEETIFSDAEIKAFDAENAGRKEDLRKLVDPADQMRRDLQAGLLKAVRERHAAGAERPKPFTMPVHPQSKPMAERKSM